MNHPQVYMCPPSQISLPPHTPTHPSGLSQCTGFEFSVPCIKPGLVICFTYGNIHVSMLLSQIIPPLPSPRVQKSVLYICVSWEFYYRGAWWSTVHGVAKSQTKLTTYTVLNVLFQTELFLLLLSYMSSLSILEIKPLLVISFANVFTCSADCLFIVLMISFAVQMLASLIRSYLFIFISIALGDWGKKTSVGIMSENILPMFSSKSFMI